MTEVRISKDRVRDGIVPGVCSRHGLPDAYPCRLTLVSRSATWSYALVAVGLVGLVAAVVISQVTVSPSTPVIGFGSLVLMGAPLMSRFKVTAARWPFCAQCRTEHTRGMLLALGVVLVSAGLVGSGVWLDNVWIMLVAVGVLAAAAVVALRFSWRAMSQAMVSRQEAVVVVRRPHPHFAQAAYAPIHQ